MATVLQRTGSGTQYGKMTISFWVKRSKLGEQGIFGRRQGSATANLSTCHFGGDDSLLINFRDGGGTSKYYMITNRKFRDVGAWYHIVFAIDGTNSTAGDRSKLYINGVRETSFALLNNPSSTGYEVNMFAGGSYNTYIARGLRSQTDAWLTFEGCMSHFHCSTGYTYDADVFGSTDSTTGEWKINTSPTFTLGTDGFTILKDGNTITDQSANSNNFTVYSGTLTKTEDCPSNVFCTMNPLDNHFASSTFSHGNNTVQTSTSNYTWNTGTLGMTSGKFYWEVKYSANSNSDYYNLIGIADRPTDDIHDVLGRQTNCSNYGYYADNGGIYAKSTSITSYGNSYTVGDIVGVAVDLDNNKLYFSKNGTWQNSGVPTSGSTGTGAFSIDAISSTTTGVYFPASGDYGSSQNATNQHNFGNGYFGTTAVSSAGSNASGNGIFEYDVPTGFTALSTKGLNT